MIGKLHICACLARRDIALLGLHRGARMLQQRIRCAFGLGLHDVLASSTAPESYALLLRNAPPSVELLITSLNEDVEQYFSESIPR